MKRTLTLAIPLAVVMSMLLSSVAAAAPLINWPVDFTKLGRPDRGNFGWTNIDATYIRWDGRLWWSTSNGRLGGLRQAYAQSYLPIMEYEGYNPGLNSDCDNLNVDSYNADLPRTTTPAKLTGSCPGDNSTIKEQVDIQIDGSTTGVQGDTIYNQYIKYSKTYLNDYNPSWQEVNLTYEEGGNDLNLGKVKYDIQGIADGYPTNGRYQATCANPPGALDGFPWCP